MIHSNSSRSTEHAFSIAPQASIQRSSFDRSHCHKTTFDAGFLIPVFVDEVLPGDTFNLDMTAFARLATPIYPIMDNLFFDSHFFFCPNRLVWDNWQKFCGEQIDPGDSTDYVIPRINTPGGSGFLENSVYHYMGIPINVPNITLNALPLRAHNLIYREWYRDENLQDSPAVLTGDGPDDPANYKIYPRGKRHDYFTSCLPWPQKGPAVTLPLGLTAPVRTTDGGTVSGAQPPLRFNYASDGSLPGSNRIPLVEGTTGKMGESTMAELSGTGANFYPNNLYTDLSAATAATINELRQAFQIQKLYERDARGGTRYTEILRSHFGVTSPDARLQRPEYLGGSTSTINIHPVQQTSATASGTPLGEVSAFGTMTAHNHGFTKSFVEHGYVIGYVSVRSDYTYQQGIERMWSRSTRFDFYWPALAHIGEQAVLNKEIYAQGLEIDNATFGFQERYAEYRYKPSRVSGLFSSTAAGTLDSWHLAQDFADLPTLSEAFIIEKPPMTRVKAVTTEPDFLFDSFFRYKCARPMPMYSVPGLVDHF